MTVSPEQVNQLMTLLTNNLSEKLLVPEKELISGDSVGPFHVRELGSESYKGENHVITLRDVNGDYHRFETLTIDPIVKRIVACEDPRMANAVAVHVEHVMQLLISKDVFKNEPLVTSFIPKSMAALAVSSRSFPTSETLSDKEKKYKCNICKIAKFKNFENLSVHQSLYCKKSQIESPHIPILSSSAPTSSPLSSSLPTTLLQPTTMTSMTAPQVVLLPVALHDQSQKDLIQLMGPPQMVVPVAIGRQSYTSTPLYINNTPPGVTTPLGLQYSLGGNVPVSIPYLSIDLNRSHLSSTTPSTSGLAAMSLKRNSECSTSPLDLSKRQRHDTSGTDSDKEFHLSSTSTMDVDKPYHCTCGITFSAESSLNAHKQFYCKDVDRVEEFREPMRKVPSRCSQCDFEPQSASQLSQHIRNVHNDIQAYVCKVCGYRGYSIRGIRGHMRTHVDVDFNKLETLLANHVAEVKSPPANSSNSEKSSTDDEKEEKILVVT